MAESTLRQVKFLEWAASMFVDFLLLAVDAGTSPDGNVLLHIGPHEALLYKFS